MQNQQISTLRTIAVDFLILAACLLVGAVVGAAIGCFCAPFDSSGYGFAMLNALAYGALGGSFLGALTGGVWVGTRHK